MRYICSALIAALCAVSGFSAKAETITYKLVMKLDIPRVYDNMQSKGYRKVQKQRIVGFVTINKDAVGEPVIKTYGIFNKTHLVGGKYVTYDDTVADDVMWRYIGSNETGVFKNVQLKFSLDLDPSYNIGADEPDNALIITLSGRGVNEKYIRGMVTGQIGCGCTAYGHISPTRTVHGEVDDIAPICGKFALMRREVSGK